MRVIKKSGGSQSLAKAIKEIEKKRLAVGWNANAKYPNGTNVAEVAATQEFGSPARRIPPRPFMRPAIAHNKAKWFKSLNMSYKMIVTGKSGLNNALEMVGLQVAGDIRVSIRDVTTPPLAKATVQARRNRLKHGEGISSTISKPLIDTGVMIGSITSEVQNDS